MNHPTPSNKAFYFRPPQLTPGLDPDIKSSSTADAPPAPTSKNTIRVRTPRTASVEPEIDLPSPEPALVTSLRRDDPANAALDSQPQATDRTVAVAETAAAGAKSMIPDSGAGRDSFFTRFMGSFAADSSNAVDPVLLAALNEWLQRLIITTTTAETALRDFGAATTEQGAQIDMKFTQLEKFMHELLWIRNMRQLCDTLTLTDYADAIIAREIYTEFGNGAEVEADIAKTKSRAFDLEQFMRNALLSINKNLADLKRNAAPEKQEPTSVFRGGRQQPTHQERASPAPVPDPTPRPSDVE